MYNKYNEEKVMKIKVLFLISFFLLSLVRCSSYEFRTTDTITPCLSKCSESNQKEVFFTGLKESCLNRCIANRKR